MFLSHSDDDEFYDRTQKSTKHKNAENKSVETADSLLDKKDALIKQIEDKERLLHDDGKPAESNEIAEAGDALDAYMSSVSSQLGKLIHVFLFSYILLFISFIQCHFDLC